MQRDIVSLRGWYGLVGQQKRDTLPDDWDETRRNVAIFATSESEMLSIEGLIDGVTFPAQLQVYSDFLDLAEKLCPDVVFWLRLHPNSSNEQRKWWNDPCLQSKRNLKIIFPASPVSSYSLLQASEKSIGLGSTLCLEATYWGKPSIVLGSTYYSGIGAVYEPSSLEEACKLVNDRQLPPKPKEKAIMFGALWRCYWEELTLSKTINYYTLDFKGEQIEARQEVHNWLGECEQRPDAQGMKKWIRGRKDRKVFTEIWRKCDGWFARVPCPSSKYEQAR